MKGTTFVRKLYELHLFHHTEWKFSENAKIPHERYKTFLRKVQKSWKNFRTNVESLVKVAKSGQLFPKCRSQVIFEIWPYWPKLWGPKLKNLFKLKYFPWILHLRKALFTIPLLVTVINRWHKTVEMIISRWFTSAKKLCQARKNSSQGVALSSAYH